MLWNVFAAGKVHTFRLLPLPSRRDMLLSMPARCFLSSWRLTIRCGCEGGRRIPLPELARAG